MNTPLLHPVLSLTRVTARPRGAGWMQGDMNAFDFFDAGLNSPERILDDG